MRINHGPHEPLPVLTVAATTASDRSCTHCRAQAKWRVGGEYYCSACSAKERRHQTRLRHDLALYEGHWRRHYVGTWRGAPMKERATRKTEVLKLLRAADLPAHCYLRYRLEAELAALGDLLRPAEPAPPPALVLDAQVPS